jgi:hypothetical protein
MKKKGLIVTTIVAALLLTFNVSHAYLYINDPWNPNGDSEKNLYQIFNETFGQSLTSSDQLFTLYGLDFGDDAWWLVANGLGSGTVKFTVRYAGFEQELGIKPAAGNYQMLVTNIPQGQQNTSVAINVLGEFAFVEKASGNIWYSDNALNPNQDGVDHFNAFDVTLLYKARIDANISQAWLIAFEDYPNGYDFDYNDLVALVVEVEPSNRTTVISLSSFIAKAGNSQVKLGWTTESEVDNAGFNIYRAETQDGAYVKVNAELIAAKGSSTQGASYVFTDTSAQNRKTYYYKLEDMDFNGSASTHGPVSATPRWVFRILGK